MHHSWSQGSKDWAVFLVAGSVFAMCVQGALMLGHPYLDIPLEVQKKSGDFAPTKQIDWWINGWKIESKKDW